MRKFEKKLRSMTAADVIRAMTAGLRKRWVSVNMATFGNVRSQSPTGKPVCFGCAATNTVCEIRGRAFSPRTIGEREAALGIDDDLLSCFELALNDLRLGDVGCYNDWIYSKLPELVINTRPDGELPKLDDDYTERELAAYDRFADKIERHLRRTRKA